MWMHTKKWVTILQAMKALELVNTAGNIFAQPFPKSCPSTHNAQQEPGVFPAGLKTMLYFGTCHWGECFDWISLQRNHWRLRGYKNSLVFVLQFLLEQHSEETNCDAQLIILGTQYYAGLPVLLQIMKYRCLKESSADASWSNVLVDKQNKEKNQFLLVPS